MIQFELLHSPGQSVILVYVCNLLCSKFLCTNNQELQTITINRTYPQFYKYARYRNLLKGGYFECSNSNNFSNAIKCTETIKPKYNGYDTLNIKTNEKYRYWRYVSPNGGKCNISEIRFLNGCQDVPIAKSLSDGDGRGGNETNDSFVFDGKESTYFVTKESKEPIEEP